MQFDRYVDAATKPRVRRMDRRWLYTAALLVCFTTASWLIDPPPSFAETEAESEGTVSENHVEPHTELPAETAVEDEVETETETAVEDEVETEASEEETVVGFEVIVVEAQRRSEDLQTVPESVSSFSANDLFEQGLEDFTDLQFSVPNLFAGSGGLTQITMRGVGSEIVGPGIDPGFAVHVNGVFSSREGTGLIDFFDIERVDVLRGPQGTLWGRNSTGGAVNIVTKRAEHDFDVYADAEYGAYREGGDATRVMGMLNMPLVENEVALRVAFMTYFDEGNTRSIADTNDQRVNTSGALSMRASLRWEPTSDLTIDLIGSYLRSDTPGRAPKFDGDYFSPIAPVSDGFGPGFDYTDAESNPKNPYRIVTDERQQTRSKVYSLTLLANWRAEKFSIDSITGYQSTDYKLHRDADGSSLPIATLDLKDKSRQISQEFLINSTWARRFNYTLGTNYMYDWTPETDAYIPNAQNTAASEALNLLAGLPVAGGGFITFVDGCTGPGAPGCPAASFPGSIRDDFVNAHTEVKNHIYGAYGNFSFDLTEDLTLSAGGRFSYTYRDWDDSTVAQSFARGVGIFNLQVLQLGKPQKKSWKSGTWKASAEYRLLDDHNLSASVSTGSRAGGFSFIDEQSFGAERVLAVEARTKSVFFDRRLMINITGFWYDWDDPQIQSTEDSLPITVNAPSAESYGVELEFRAMPVAELALNGSFGWLEANYNKRFVTIDRADPDLDELSPLLRNTEVDIDGNRLPRSPRFTVSAGVQYEVFLGDYGSITPRVDFYYRGKVAFRQYEDSRDEQSSYTRTDARITWSSETEQFWVQVFARNLENEHVKTNQELVAGIYRQHYYDPPRSGGFRAGYNFY